MPMWNQTIVKHFPALLAMRGWYDFWIYITICISLEIEMQKTKNISFRAISSVFQYAYLSTHTVYLYKIQFFSLLWPHWKMDTGKHSFHEILLLCKTAKRLKNCWTSSRHMPSPDWPRCSRLRNLVGSEILSCVCVFRTSLLFPSTATRASWNSKCRCHQWNNKRPWPA